MRLVIGMDFNLAQAMMVLDPQQLNDLLADYENAKREKRGILVQINKLIAQKIQRESSSDS